MVCRYGVLGIFLIPVRSGDTSEIMAHHLSSGIVFDTRDGKDVRFESAGYRFRYPWLRGSSSVTVVPSL